MRDSSKADAKTNTKAETVESAPWGTSIVGKPYTFMDVAMPYIIGAVVLGLIIFGIVSKYRMIAQKKAMDFEWFKSNFSANVVGNKVTCPKCQGGNIGTERLMNQTYLRKHLCRTCGTTLYYSPE